MSIVDYLKYQEEKGLLRFITCGSVDDGKSTLIGRLLWDSKLIYEDQLESLKADSRKVGTQNGEIDYALLLDGLQAEREQGITIDVAYRFFSTDKRKFIVADTPGHEQYTRNMITGASNASVAVILVDARKGILTQTRRHNYLVSLVGIHHVVLAINKMDLVDYSKDVYYKILADYEVFARELGFDDVMACPVSALRGDNMIGKSENTPWYSGPSLLYLETVQVADEAIKRPFRFPVQWVNRPNLDFRGFSGTVASGEIRIGDTVIVPSSGQEACVSDIVTADGSLQLAHAGQAVTIALDREIDVSRGDVLCPPTERPEVVDQFKARLVWMHEQPLLPGRSYLARLGTSLVPAEVTELSEKVDVNTLDHLPAKKLDLNEVGVVKVSLGKPVAFDRFVDDPATGCFVLIDRLSFATVGAGMIEHPLRRATNVHWQALEVDRVARGTLMNQTPKCFWFTGLSGSGKSTIANELERQLYAMGKHTYVLDGDNVRHGLNKDLGFTQADRVENIRRIAEAARLMVDAGLIVICSFISPFRSERRMARELFGAGEFVEVFVDTPLAICEERDIKGLYRKARAGELPNFTGIDSPYEAPEQPEIRIDGASMTTEGAAELCRELI